MSKPQVIQHNINKYNDRLPDLQAYTNESGQCDLNYRLKTGNHNRIIDLPPPRKTTLKPLQVNI